MRGETEEEWHYRRGLPPPLPRLTPPPWIGREPSHPEVNEQEWYVGRDQGTTYAKSVAPRPGTHLRAVGDMVTFSRNFLVRNRYTFGIDDPEQLVFARRDSTTMEHWEGSETLFGVTFTQKVARHGGANGGEKPGVLGRIQVWHWREPVEISVFYTRSGELREVAGYVEPWASLAETEPPLTLQQALAAAAALVKEANIQDYGPTRWTSGKSPLWTERPVFEPTKDRSRIELVLTRNINGEVDSADGLHLVWRIPGRTFFRRSDTFGCVGYSLDDGLAPSPSAFFQWSYERKGVRAVAVVDARTGKVTVEEVPDDATTEQGTK